MKKIYIVITFTGTILSRIVRLITKKTYCHASISLDKNLDNMYSFGRKNPYLLLPAGFIHEYKDKGTFKRFYKTKAKIYELEVNQEQYNELKKLIRDFNNNKDNLQFNIIGLVTAIFRLKIKRRKHYYCSEFVKYALDKSNIETNLPKCTRPDDFQILKNAHLIYQGELRNY